MKIKISLKKILTLSLLVLGLVTASVKGHTQDLVIALRAEPTTLDPMYYALTANMQLSESLFDSLVHLNKHAQPMPALAESWRVNVNTWTFYLRKDVFFTDGSPLTAADILFSYERVHQVSNRSPSYTLYLNAIDEIKALDEHTVQIITKGPAPVLLANLAMIPILSHRAAANDDLVGTGPYAFVSWQRGQEIIFKRNDDYWGPKPAWAKVTYTLIPDANARVVALLAGEVDLIEDPPTEDIIDLKQDPRFYVQETPSLKVIYIALNQGMKIPAGMKGVQGNNPLADKRVREALSLAIDRQVIIERIMGNGAKAAGNILPPSAFGASAKLVTAPKQDQQKAKQLLADAGYANGFSLSLGSPMGLYTNDQYIAQEVALMWAQIGVQTQVEATAPALFFRLRDQYAFSAYLAAWSISTGEMLNPLQALVMTKDPIKGVGTTNWSKYSNPELDALVLEASRTVDDDARTQMLQKAGHMVMEDYGILPLQFEMSVWAMNKDIMYEGRADQMTLSQYMTLNE